jgi:hypothetical protein
MPGTVVSRGQGSRSLRRPRSGADHIGAGGQVTAGVASYLGGKPVGGWLGADEHEHRRTGLALLAFVQTLVARSSNRHDSYLFGRFLILCVRLSSFSASRYESDSDPRSLTPRGWQRAGAWAELGA